MNKAFPSQKNNTLFNNKKSKNKNNGKAFLKVVVIERSYRVVTLSSFDTYLVNNAACFTEILARL